MLIIWIHCDFQRIPWLALWWWSTSFVSWSRVYWNKGTSEYLGPCSTCCRHGHWLGSPGHVKSRERGNIKARVSVHWRAQCHEKGPRDGRKFQHSAGFETISQLSFDSPYPKKMQCELWYLSALNPVLEYKKFIFGFLKSNIEVRQDTTEFLTTSLWLTHS